MTNTDLHPSTLPDDHVTRVFSSMKRLAAAANEVFTSLNKQESSNQWILVLGLSAATIKRLADDHRCLDGINYRFQWEGTSGLIKVVPSARHEIITAHVVDCVKDVFNTMGITWRDGEWVGATTYKPSPAKGKEPDNAFVPPSRCPTIANLGWPTLVIETGVSESLTQLRADAAKWFKDSSGGVRIVLVIAIRNNRVDIEKWQLAPVGAPVPLTRPYITSLCSQRSNMPPLVPQLPAIQQPYCAQEIVITRPQAPGLPATDTGTPLILPFHALYDRAPGRGERDIIITSRDCNDITRRLW
jgi:hypothetical protein